MNRLSPDLYTFTQKVKLMQMDYKPSLGGKVLGRIFML